MTRPAAALREAVQINCHIADARHAQDLSLCTFLLQMREFHRWERGLPLNAPLVRSEIGAWIARREALWADLEAREFAALPLGDGRAPGEPFGVEAVNALLAPQGLVYGAGWESARRPAFFLAELIELRPIAAEGLVVQVCGREWARGLFAPPAALAGDTVVLRRESMARWLWEKFEVFGLKRADGPFKAVARAYDLESDFLAGLPRMLDEQAETLILHEIGEHRAGRRLGPAWGEIRLALDDRRSELLLRAVRDQIADLGTTLPALIERGDAVSLHFWFAGYDGLRKQLFPGLAEAYRAWCEGDGAAALQQACAAGACHFEDLAAQVLELHLVHGSAASRPIAALLASPQAVCGP
ncbi:MAG: Sfum_1244 family protein [Piscinibacter sp.]|uniref:Sfum_1244 family protein n=1 Tax=Piscinibacter sp. TaxID=1903157 RepID=UPI003D141D2F